MIEEGVSEGANTFPTITSTDCFSWLDTFGDKVEGKDNKRIRRQAISFLVNNVWLKNISFKMYKYRGHRDAIKRPHKAWTKA